MNYKIEISVQNPSWNTHQQINAENITFVLQNILKRYQKFNSASEIEISILLTDNAKIEKLNAKFRGKNNSTNVLSFPDQHISWQNINSLKLTNGYIYLGDIAFAYEYMLNESLYLKKNFFSHFQHLFIHSVLHLIGYSHENDNETELMEFLEQEILNDVNHIPIKTQESKILSNNA